MNLPRPSYQGMYDGAGNSTKVFFGRDALTDLPSVVDEWGERALLITGNTIHTKTDLVDKLTELLGQRLVGVFAESASHTPRSTVLRASEMARSLKPDCLISLGGGGATDVGKAVTLALWLDIEKPDDFDRAFQQLRSGGAKSVARRSLPQITLPTTLVSAEHSDGVGITDDVTHQKQVFLSRNIQAAAIVLDPSLSKYTPQPLWLSTGVKSLDHAIAKLSSPDRHPLIDASSSLAIQILGTELARCYDDPEDMDCRAQLQLGAWMSMFGSGSIPGKRQGLSHALGRQIGGVSGASHGMIASVVLAPSMDFNAKEAAPGLLKVAEAFGIAEPGMLAEEAARAASDSVRKLVAHLGLPNRLRDIGVPIEKLPVIADRTMKDVFIDLNPRKISGSAEVLEFLEAIW